MRYGALCPEQRATCAARSTRCGSSRTRTSRTSCAAPAQISAARRTSAPCQRACRAADVREYHLDAELLHEFRMGGSQYPAYGSIVAAGANACVLHYRADAARCATASWC